MQIETINKETRLALEKIAKLPFLEKFYLAGGTALAMHLGHRESIDLDFFSAEKFSTARTKEELSRIGELKVDYEDEDTLSGLLDGVKLSFFHYAYAQLFPLADFQGTKIADERDIAAMKIDTISARGSRKDFIDLYFLLQKYSLIELIGFFEKKYSRVKYNKLHILKSLVFFENAEDDPAPMMVVNANWDDIKNCIESETKKLI